MKKYIIFIVLVLAAFLVALYYVANGNTPRLGAVENLYMTENSVQSMALVSSASSTILAANTARRYAVCTSVGTQGTSNGNSKTVFLSFGSTPSQSWGIPLTASSSFTINGANLFVGALKGVTPYGTGGARVKITCLEE